MADRAGTGTTLYTADNLARFAPQFGAGSCAAHRAAGAVEIGGDAMTSVRQDVDTPDDLADALTLGVGARTAWVTWQAGLRVP